MNTVDVGNFGIVVLTFVKIIFQFESFSKKSTGLGEASALGDANVGTSIVHEILKWQGINLYPYILLKLVKNRMKLYLWCLHRDLKKMSNLK